MVSPIIIFLSSSVIRIIRNRGPEEHSPAVIAENIKYRECQQTGNTYRLGDTKVVVLNDLIKVFMRDILIFEELEFRSHKNKIIWRHRVPKGLHIFGFGEKGGPLDKRGWKKLILRNEDPGAKYWTPKCDPLYINIPFYIMARPGFSLGIFIDSPSYMQVDPCVSVSDVLSIVKYGEDLDYYIFIGENPAEIIEQFTDLVGRTYMPPLWSLGFHQSKWSYKSAREVLTIAKNFRRYGIPCDAIHLDIDYMDGYRVFTWNRKRFPDPRGLIDRLHRDGFKVVVIIDPYVKYDKKYPLYVEILKKRYYVKTKSGKPFFAYGWPGRSLMPDLTIPECREWWGRQYVNFHEKYRNDGFWNDMNEPSVETRIRVLLGYGLKKDDIIFHDGGRNSDARLVGNMYGFLEQKSTYEALRKIGKRFFILSRSGFAGIQRYSSNWTGDIWSTWGHLEGSISMILNLGLCGIVFVGADIGGFAPLVLKADPKLFARWIQLGVFYPFMRVHYMKYKPSQEPWSFGDTVRRISRKFIRFRYRLLPYIYSLFWESRKNGLPIMRPLFLEFPDDEQAYTINNQFMFGPSMLVAPITSREDRRRIYFPRGFWLDFAKRKVIRSSGEWIEYRCRLDRIPMFIRDGGIVVMQRPINYVGEENIAEYQIYMFSRDKEGTFIIYEDDGESYEFEKGYYSETKITVHKEKIDVEVIKDDYGESVKTLKFYYYTEDRPMEVIVNREAIDYRYTGKYVVFTIPKKSSNIEIHI